MDDERGARLTELIQQLFQTCTDLEAMFPGRPFTPDGHTMGSIGEVMAAAHYGLRLHQPSNKGRDALAEDGRAAEVKATGGKRGGATRIAFSEDPGNIHVLVVRISPDGVMHQEFNGPGNVLLSHLSSRGKNGQRTISLAKLRQIQAEVAANESLAPRSIKARLPVSDSSER